MKSKILVFDVETTGLPEKGLNYLTDYEKFPRVVEIAWIFEDQERRFIIKPTGYTIPAESTKVHRIDDVIANDLGVDFEFVAKLFIEECQKADAVVAHNAYFDSSIVKAHILNNIGKDYYSAFVEDALHKDKRVDTMKQTIKFVGAKFRNGRAGKFPNLQELHEKLFGCGFEDAHSALIDTRVTLKCLKELVKLGEITLPTSKVEDNPKQDIEKIDLINDKLDF